MKRNADFSEKSSFLARTSSLAALAVGAAYCKVFHFDRGCIFLTGLFLCCLLSRLWARLSSRNLTFTVDADRWRIFPGQTLTVTLSVKNNKLFPVVWLELVQFFRENAPLLPDQAQLKQLSDTEADREGFYHQNVYSMIKKYSLLFSGQEISCSYPLTGIRRGIRQPQNLLLRTGDGIGLTTLQMQVCPGQKQFFVVYPELCPVDTSLFLRNVWTSQACGSGELEDPTLLKTTRPYQYGDSFRKINWRTMAMGLAMEVNVMETIRPQNAHFILDGESYQGKDPAPQLLEEAISIIASLIMELESRNIHCGLSLPEGAGTAAVTISAYEEHDPSDLLFHLAAYEPYPQQKDEYGKALPAKASRFSAEGLKLALVRKEKIYIITRDASFCPSDLLLQVMEQGGLILYSSPADRPSAWRGVSLDLVRRAGADSGAGKGFVAGVSLGFCTGETSGYRSGIVLPADSGTAADSGTTADSAAAADSAAPSDPGKGGDCPC